MSLSNGFARVPQVELLEAKLLLSAFVSTSAGGDWAALGTWQSQDGTAVTRVPAANDTVTIAGPVSVTSPVAVGTGSGDVITMSSTSSKLTLTAGLTVRGSILFSQKGVIDVQAGSGIELDANAGATPKIHAPSYPSGLSLYFHGTAENHSYLRTKPGTAGNPGQVLTETQYWVPVNVAGSYVDFTDLNAGIGASDDSSGVKFGIAIWPGSSSQISTLDHATFTRTSLFVKITSNQGSSPFTISNSIFSQTPAVFVGDNAFGYGAYLTGGSNGCNNLLSIIGNGFDKQVWLASMKDVSSNAFIGNVYFNKFSGTGFSSWSDNLINVFEPGSYQFIVVPGTYSRTYFICPVPNVYNPHVVDTYNSPNTTFDHNIWDVPTASFVDDALLSLGSGVKNLTIQRNLTLPRSGGKNAGSGIALGSLGGTGISYSHNTITLGVDGGVFSDLSHGGTTGGITQFKSNIGWTRDDVPYTGKMFDNVQGYYLNPVLPENADYNAKYRATYGGQFSTTPGAHDVDANPNFEDPSRNLVQYYRMYSGNEAGTLDADITAALDWMRQHPDQMPKMIDWVFTGFTPTNMALRAAHDTGGTTDGWIGAMRGVRRADTNGDYLVNGQDIYPFLQALSSPDLSVSSPAAVAADLNGDGLVNGQDIFGFLQALAAPAAASAAAEAASTGTIDAASVLPLTTTAAPQPADSEIDLVQGPASYANDQPLSLASSKRALMQSDADSVNDADLFDAILVPVI